MTAPLPPCPFCASLQVATTRNLVGQHIVRCNACGASGPVTKSPQDAAAKYSHREYEIAVKASAAARLADDLDPLFNPKGITS